MLDEALRLNEKITIIGTGNYGIAIGNRLMNYGYDVIYGSRNPNFDYLKECFNDQNKFTVTTIIDACLKADKFIFLAISAENNNYENFANEINNLELNKDLILIEISNYYNNNDISNAEKLKDLLINKRIDIVKGFNLISSYSMRSCLNIEQKGNNNEINVPICGDNLESKQLVTLLCNRINLKANDIGLLKLNALKLEKLNQTTFIEWKMPSLISLIFLLLNIVWIYIHYYFFPKKSHDLEEYLKNSSLLAHLNKVLGFTSLQMLSFVYFTSSIASVYQLYYGTRYKRFPKYLDFILKSRKQFGLWSFLFASLHVLCTIFISNPAYLSDWYQELTINNSSKWTIHAEINFLSGILAFIIMLLIALSSINSIANSFNWNEWHFVQTKLGLVCLFIALMHSVSMYLNIFFKRNLNNYSTLYLITRVKLIGCYFPAFVLIIRFIFAYFPLISKRLENIRKGITIKKNKSNV